MAFLEGLKFTGKLGELTAYRMRGCSKIVVRSKGGPSAEQIKTSPKFKNTRYTMSEFGGCSRMGKHVRMALHPLKVLADNNFGSDINSVMRKVQLQDKTSLWGRRNIILSDHARILEGFPLNAEQPTFDSVVRNPLYHEVDRASRSATVDIPALSRGINYFPQNGHALFRVIITLGVVPDMLYDEGKGEYKPPAWYNAAYFPTEVTTSWYPSLEGMPAMTLTLAVDKIPPDTNWSLMLSIGIQYGSLRDGGEIREVKRFGTAKIVALVGRSRGQDGLPEVVDAPVSEPAEQLVAPASEAQTPDAETPLATAPARHEPRQPAVWYHYVPHAATAKQPEVTTYIYTYTVAEKTEPESQSEKGEPHSLPARTVRESAPEGYSVGKSTLMPWPVTDHSVYECPFSQAVASSSRYLMVGQWRL